MQIRLNNTLVTLLPQKALFLEEASVLVIADVHLGKAAHFRKAGIIMPGGSIQKDFRVLDTLLAQYQPKEVWFLGDLSHSSYNSEWLQLETLLRQHAQVRFVLIRGNHDILEDAHYEAAGIHVVAGTLETDGLIFSHEPLPAVPSGSLNVAGHLHPGYAWRGKGRQYLRLPCFYLTDTLLLLPAFGSLTGLYIMERTSLSYIFGILPDRVVQMA